MVSRVQGPRFRGLELRVWDDALKQCFGRPRRVACEMQPWPHCPRLSDSFTELRPSDAAQPQQALST